MNRIGLGVMAVVFSVTRIPAAEREGIVAAQQHVQVADLTPVTLHPVDDHPPVPLVSKGQPRAVIYVAQAHRSERLKLLLAELVETIRLTTGAELSIVDQPPATDQPALIIGASPETHHRIDATTIPIEGYRVLTASHRVYLIGSTAAMPYPAEIREGGHHPYTNDGTAWAVADFLERFVDVRWYWPLQAQGRSISKADTLMVSPSHYSDAPVFQMRTHHPPFCYTTPWKSRWNDKGDVPVEFQGQTKEAETAKVEPATYPRLPVPVGLKELDMRGLLTFLRSGNSWPYQIRVHEPQSYWRRGDAWVKENEALFALREDGSRNTRIFCYSSPATLAFLLDGCEQVWERGGNASWVTPNSVTVSPADVAVTCHCQACQALWVPDDWLWAFDAFVEEARQVHAAVAAEQRVAHE